MRPFLCAWIAMVVQAAGIHGMVVENQTGRPVSRVVVQVQPVSGTPGQTLSVRTNRVGGFELGALAAGSYLVTASRRGFMPAEYGQKRWNSAGVPLTLQAEENAAVTIRLLRYAAISGIVMDENQVGLPDVGVAVYRPGSPPQLVANGRSDDAGVYRISGLEPGTYLVRNTAKLDEDEEYAPTFARETLRVEEARPIPVFPEDETRGVEVQALPGRLYTLAGMASPAPSGAAVRITLASDMGRQTVEGPAFRFSGLSPGQYELFAEVHENPSLNIPELAAYQRVSLDRDTNIGLTLQEIRETRVDIEPAGARNSNAMPILARHKDLAGAAPPERLPLTNGRARLAPGRWELLLPPPAGYYVSGFSGPGMSAASRGRPDGWNEVVILNFAAVRFSLDGGPGGLRGTVQRAGEPVLGAPVYLESYDPVNRKRLTDLQTTRTDVRGLYQFRDLAPGAYRLLSTFEYQSPASEVMDLAAVRSVQIEAHQEAQIDLDLYVLP